MRKLPGHDPHAAWVKARLAPVPRTQRAQAQQRHGAIAVGCTYACTESHIAMIVGDALLWALPWMPCLILEQPLLWIGHVKVLSIHTL